MWHYDEYGPYDEYDMMLPDDEVETVLDWTKTAVLALYFVPGLVILGAIVRLMWP